MKQQKVKKTPAAGDWAQSSRLSCAFDGANRRDDVGKRRSERKME
jgi:hypothetical protein